MNDGNDQEALALFFVRLLNKPHYEQLQAQAVTEGELESELIKWAENKKAGKQGE